MISILIPTKNRSDFLIRLLNYYADTNYKHWLIIGDSSDSFHRERIKSEVKRLEKKLKIVYREYPDLNWYESFRELLEIVATPYTVYIGDDDFLVPAGLEECVGFLENNKEYIGANGVGAVFSLEGSGPKGKFLFVERYGEKNTVEADTASQRLLEYFPNYFVTLFSVQRTQVRRKLYEHIKDRAFGEELLPCSLAVIQGKIKHLDCFYLVRHDNTNRYLLPDRYDWITSENWFPSYKVFSNYLAEELIKQDGITKDKAQEVVKEAFWSYLETSLTREFQHRYGKNHQGVFMRMKEDLKSIPGANEYLLPMWRSVKLSMVPLDHISLPALLRPSSPYHRDFMPVYRAVTEGGDKVI